MPREQDAFEQRDSAPLPGLLPAPAVEAVPANDSPWLRALESGPEAVRLAAARAQRPALGEAQNRDIAFGFGALAQYLCIEGAIPPAPLSAFFASLVESAVNKGLYPQVKDGTPIDPVHGEAIFTGAAGLHGNPHCMFLQNMLGPLHLAGVDWDSVQNVNHSFELGLWSRAQLTTPHQYIDASLGPAITGQLPTADWFVEVKQFPSDPAWLDSFNEEDREPIKAALASKTVTREHDHMLMLGFTAAGHFVGTATAALDWAPDKQWHPTNE